MQVYRCKSCKREFTELNKSKHSRHRFPKKTILFSVMLYRYGLSSYEISDILKKKFRKFGNIKHFLRDLNIKFGKIWHADEMFIKAKGRIHYLYAVIDDKSQLLFYMSLREGICIPLFFAWEKPKYIAGKPEIIVTDRWYAYPKAIRKVFGRKTKG